MGLGKKMSEIEKALNFLTTKLEIAQKNNDVKEIKIIERAIKEQRRQNTKLVKVKHATQWHK